MKIAAYIGGLLGLALLTAIFIREGYSDVLRALDLAGWPLLWLVPYRLLFFLLYALSWRILLQPYDPQRRANLGYLLWVTTVREAIDRLLPVASVGGSVAGVRLLRIRGLAVAPAAATVIMEILLTLIVMYLFTALGLMLIELNGSDLQYHGFLLGFLLSLPVPVITWLLLRYGSLFKRLQGFLRVQMGAHAFPGELASLDEEIRACYRRWRALLAAGALQFIAFVSCSFEIWFALRLFGHPVGAGSAVILESLTQALRHFAFMVPAGLGVQEAGLVLFGHVLGIGSELALAVSMAKRMREVLCGLPSLLSWQWLEGRWLHALITRQKADSSGP